MKTATFIVAVLSHGQSEESDRDSKRPYGVRAIRCVMHGDGVIFHGGEVRGNRKHTWITKLAQGDPLMSDDSRVCVTIL
jgi:hypothetical protein